MEQPYSDDNELHNISAAGVSYVCGKPQGDIDIMQSSPGGTKACFELIITAHKAKF